MPIPYQGQRAIQDRSWTGTAFALPAAASSSTAQATPAAFDLGTDPFKAEEFDAVLVVPALNATMIPNGFTVTHELQTSTVANFATTVHALQKTFTGAGGVGVPAQETHFRLPPDCPQFVRWRVTLGASTTNSSAVSATPSLRF